MDNVLIGAGFTLLRFTGQIDPEGRGWLVEALLRQGGAGEGSFEYVTMLKDLDTFAQEPTTTPAAAPKRPTRKPATQWLTIEGNANTPPHAAWMRKVAKVIDSDTAWTQWWLASGVPRLVLQPHPGGRDDSVMFFPTKRGLEVLGTSAAVIRYLDEVFAVENEAAGRLWDSLPQPLRTYTLT